MPVEELEAAVPQTERSLPPRPKARRCPCGTCTALGTFSSPTPKAELFSLQCLRDPTALWLLLTQKPAAFQQARDPSARCRQLQSPHGAELPPKGAGRQCMVALHQTHLFIGEGAGQDMPASSCLHLSISGLPCHHWVREWAGDISCRAHSSIRAAQHSSLKQGSHIQTRGTVQLVACELPVSCRDPKISSHMGQSQMSKPRTFDINHSSVPLYRCCSVLLLVLMGFWIITIIIIPCDVVPEV